MIGCKAWGPRYPARDISALEYFHPHSSTPSVSRVSTDGPFNVHWFMSIMVDNVCLLGCGDPEKSAVSANFVAIANPLSPQFPANHTEMVPPR